MKAKPNQKTPATSKNKKLTPSEMANHETILKDAVNGLSSEETQILAELMQSLVNGNTQPVNEIYDVDYRVKPPTPEEFLNDPKYVGEIAKNIYPQWRENFIKLYNDQTKFYVIATGAIGIGKDWFTELCIAYELVKLGCLRNPHKFYRRAINTDIVISVISITKAQTKNVFFNQLKSLIDTSEWMQKYFPRNKDKNDIIEFFSPADDGTGKMGKIRVMYGAPNNAAVIGENVLIAIIDEANFMQVIQKSKRERGANKEYDQATKIHDNLLRRMKSRFLQDGRIAGKMFVLSSRQYPDDFVERKIKELKNDPHTVIFEYAIYQMKPWDYYKMTPKTFDVLIGNAEFPSKILLPGEAVSPDCHIEKVPMELYEDYVRDLDGSIRDFSGIATQNVQTFIKQYNKIYECIKDDECPEFYSSQVTNFEDGADFIYEIIDKIDKTAPRAIHLDLSSTGDSTGIAMVHCAGMKEICRTQSLFRNGKLEQVQVKEQAPVYKVDFVLEITPPPNKEIVYANVRQLIITLREFGFNIVSVSADKYQSRDTLQILNENGFDTFYISVDTTREPYDNLKQAIYDGRFETYHHEKLILELVNLEDDKKRKKIDHKNSGMVTSKDCSDAVAGACWGLTQVGMYGGNMTEPSLGYMMLLPSQVTVEKECEDYEQDFMRSVLERK